MLIYTLCSTSTRTLIVLQESGYWWNRNTVQFCKIRPQHKIFLARPCPSFRADYQSRKTKLTFKKNYICDHFLCSLSCLTYCPFFLFIILSLGQNIVSCCFKVHYKKISLKGCQSSRFTQTRANTTTKSTADGLFDFLKRTKANIVQTFIFAMN